MVSGYWIGKYQRKKFFWRNLSHYKVICMEGQREPQLVQPPSVMNFESETSEIRNSSAKDSTAAVCLLRLIKTYMRLEIIRLQ